MSPDAESVFFEEVHTLKRHSSANSGNGRMVRNFVEKIIREQSARIAVNDIPEDAVNVIIPSDIRDNFVRNLDYDLEKELNKVIGLEKVKGLYKHYKFEQRNSLDYSAGQKETSYRILTKYIPWRKETL